MSKNSEHVSAPRSRVRAGKIIGATLGVAVALAGLTQALAVLLPPAPAVPPLPPPPPRTCSSGCDVDRNGRVAVLLNNVVDAGIDGLMPLYQFLESSGGPVTRAELHPHYRDFYELAGADATPSKLRSKLLQLQNDSSVKAIDLFISLHGKNEKLTFAGNDRVRVVNLAADIARDRISSCMNAGARDLACELGKQSRLRIVYSAACHGKSHIAAWLAAGFAAASGAAAIHADSVASYPTFLNTWRSGYSFSESVDRANSADRLRAYDQWARLQWSDVDSRRDYRGAPGVNASSLAFWSIPSKEFLFCAKESESCTVPGTVDVIYGASRQHWRYNVTGTFQCDNATFGDPAPNESKICLISRNLRLPGYTFCAREGQQCNFSGTRTVAYGAAGVAVYRQASGGIQCNNSTFGDPIRDVGKSCYVAAQELVYCASEGGLCTVPGTADVVYGASRKHWRYNVTGAIRCDNATFGDPAPNESKSCSYTTQLGLPGYTYCAREGQQCNFSGSKTVAYGAAGIFTYRQASGGVRCDNATLGDPIANVGKSCYIK